MSGRVNTGVMSAWFYLVEAPFAVLSPYELLVLLEELSHWLGGLGKSFDKTAIISGQSKETPDF